MKTKSLRPPTASCLDCLLSLVCDEVNSQTTTPGLFENSNDEAVATVCGAGEFSLLDSHWCQRVAEIEPTHSLYPSDPVSHEIVGTSAIG